VKPVDCLGRTIETNHVIVYPVRRGSDMQMKTLTVSQVYDKYLTGYSPAGQLLTLTNLKNVVIVRGGNHDPL
jgi:hypothetical protein